ncbi:HAD-IIA family hydrolase [Sulfurospirillum deleyianum]|uniref:HAD-superfamily hydrolase, subfamily IIA n=1 Tax=Sulfurospirillum deleyianum (strain ATCC 51133 / DSM 6946 / 5175) TaxID=525898 RepID=D1B0D4_SULD5|nr:HAD-IIA family hydrolase [Sulfurospirillum deleyianum]ACZ11253.1 HAD-superfamily hydrolase, subfamily IIA [Sulfurospirillum deleyianum DSM 6946]
MSYFIDVQGTLIDDVQKKPIKGAIEFIDALNRANIPYVVITNNTKIPSQEFHDFLNHLGFSIPQGHYLDPFMALEKVLHVKAIRSFGAQEFVDVMEKLGYEQDAKNPEAIVIASKKDFDANDYASMIELVLGGAKIVGMHATSIYAKDKRRFPGVGAILQMLSYATGAEYSVVGKPSTLFYTEALKLLEAQGFTKDFEAVTIISDDAIGDLIGAKALGMKTILVLSGKCQREEEVLHVKESLDAVVADIGQIKGVTCKQ